MSADDYRRQAWKMQRLAMSAADAFIKSNLEQLAEQWLALADQAERLEQKYGPIVLQAADSQPVLQQQWQPQKHDKAE